MIEATTPDTCKFSQSLDQRRERAKHKCSLGACLQHLTNLRSNNGSQRQCVQPTRSIPASNTKEQQKSGRFLFIIEGFKSSARRQLFKSQNQVVKAWGDRCGRNSRRTKLSLKNQTKQRIGRMETYTNSNCGCSNLLLAVLQSKSIDNSAAAEVPASPSPLASIQSRPSVKTTLSTSQTPPAIHPATHPLTHRPPSPSRPLRGRPSFSGATP